MRISPCKQVCSECGFVKSGTKDTLYAEAFDMIQTGTVFPCHMYLRAHTGSESYGTETLKDIQVCRGYVAHVAKYYPEILESYRADIQYIWFQYLLPHLDSSDFEELYTPEELIQAHKGLREHIQLGNQICKK